MRRWGLFFLMLLLVGCGGSSATPTALLAPSPSAAPTTASSAVPTTAPTSAPTAATAATVAAPTAAATSASGTSASSASTSSVAVPTTAATKAPAVAANGDLTQLHVGDNGDGYGFNVWGLSADQSFRDKVYTNVQGAGFGWVRQQVLWASMEPQKGNYGNDTTAQLDQFVNGASAKGLKVLLSVVEVARLGRREGWPADEDAGFHGFHGLPDPAVQGQGAGVRDLE